MWNSLICELRKISIFGRKISKSPYWISSKSDILLITKETSRNNDDDLLPTKNIEIVTIHPSEKIMSQTYLMCAIVAGSIGGVIIASVIICLTAYRLIKRDMGSYSIPNKHHFWHIWLLFRFDFQWTYDITRVFALRFARRVFFERFLFGDGLIWIWNWIWPVALVPGDPIMPHVSLKCLIGMVKMAGLIRKNIGYRACM